MSFQVQDFNDCPPVFVNHPTSVTVAENNNVNSVLQIFAVQDCDSGINGANGTLFSIISGTLHIILTNHLTHEHTRKLNTFVILLHFCMRLADPGF